MAQHSNIPGEVVPSPAEPPRDCPLCPRLVAYRRENQELYPDWFNGPALLVRRPRARGCWSWAWPPAAQGANRTGRPFTGDYAGTLLYDTLIKYGFATGKLRGPPRRRARADRPHAVTNAVRCAPPGNKPCRPRKRTPVGRS